MKRKLISISLFLIGLLVLTYPLISQTYYDYIYKQEVEEIQKEFEETNEFSEILYQEQLNYNQNNVSILNEIEVANLDNVNTADDESNDQNNSAGALNRDILGTLTIPSIDLTYPIYDGATDVNLMKGVARLEGTSFPVGGINTNSVIAGHNSTIDKVFFSRLTRLVDGDLIYVRNRKETLVYEVYDTAIIEPTDVAALAIVPGQDIITLLTCTFPNTHRYLVYARRV